MIDDEEVRWLWANDFFDGPLSGVCEYKGRKYYAVIIEQDENTRLYSLIDLPEEEWKYELTRHDLFVEKVGSHHDFTIREVELKPKESWKELYDRYPLNTVRDYTQYISIGTFRNEYV